MKEIMNVPNRINVYPVIMAALEDGFDQAFGCA